MALVCVDIAFQIGKQQVQFDRVPGESQHSGYMLAELHLNGVCYVNAVDGEESDDVAEQMDCWEAAGES